MWHRWFVDIGNQAQKVDDSETRSMVDLYGTSKQHDPEQVIEQPVMSPAELAEALEEIKNLKLIVHELKQFQIQADEQLEILAGQQLFSDQKHCQCEGSITDSFQATQEPAVSILDPIWYAKTTHPPDTPYGSLYLHEGAQNIDISTAGQGVYVKITGFTTGKLNRVTINSDAFNVQEIGTYKADWQVSGDSQGNNKDYEVDVFVNGVEQDDGSARRAYGAAGSLGSMSGTAVIDVTSTSHDIDIRMKETGAGAGTDFDIFNMNFNIFRLGD
jgi:hypothetical protein